MNVDIQDKLDEMENALTKVEMIEDTLYNDYLVETEYVAKIIKAAVPSEFERIQTLHSIMADYLRQIRGAIAEAGKLNKNKPQG